MAKASTNFIAGKMNKSVDERLVPPGEYIDALNVRLGSTEATEIGAVENSKGNSLLTNVEYAGQTVNGKTLGVYEDGINETLYWFIHDSNNPSSPTGKVDLIVSFNTNTSSLTYHCISTSVLNFDEKHLITGINKIEDLLFFTDDINPPRVINVTRDYDYPVGGIDTIFKEEDISVIVKPPGYEEFDTTAGQNSPLGSPVVVPIQDYVGQENYLQTRFVTFAYRYRYTDGGYSAISLFSEPAFQPREFRFSIDDYLNAGMYNVYKAFDVTFSTGTKRVVEIDLLFKQTTSNVINVIKRFKKDDLGIPNNDTMTHRFTNSEIYTTLGSDELLRLYDNVPRTAKAQTIKGNRLIYGNYVDGYDLLSAFDGNKIPINYTVAPVFEEIAGVPLGNGSVASPAQGGVPAVAANPLVQTSAYTIGGGALGTDSRLTWDLTAANPTSGDIKTGTTFFFGFSISQNSITCNDYGTGVECSTNNGNNFIQQSPFTIRMSFTCSVDYPNVTQMCASQEFKERIGGSIAQGFSSNSIQELYPCYNSNQGATLSDKFYEAAVTPMTGTNLELINGGRTVAQQCTPSSFPLTCSNTIITSGSTDAAVAGFLTNSNIDFTLIAGLAVGDIVMDMATGLTASVSSIAANDLGLTDINGGLVTLETSGVNYQITPASGSSALCSPSGIEFTATAGGFILELPATQYYYTDGTSPASSNYSEAFIYYNFIGYGCTAGYRQVSKTNSLHSNRDYEVGVVYMDDYGRSSTVLVSDTNTVFVEPDKSTYKNKIRVTLSNLPPYWAKKYKFVIKPSEGNYMTIFSNTFYQQDGSGKQSGVSSGLTNENDPSLVWFKLEGNNQNLVKVGDELIVKVDTGGAVASEVSTTVLAVEAFATKEITDVSLAGLYMLLKPGGFNIENTEASYFRGRMSKDANDAGNFKDGCISNYDLNDNDVTPSVPYTIPAGSTIRIKIRNWRGGGGGDCDSKSLTYDRSFVSTSDYSSFHNWAVGDDLASQMTTQQASTAQEMAISFDPVLVTSGSGCTENPFNSVCRIRQAANGKQFFVNTCNIPRCWEAFEYYNGHCSTLIEVTRGGSLFVFETVPQDADPNLFYDASELLDIEPQTAGAQPYHMANTIYDVQSNTYSLAPNSVNQSPTTDLTTDLTAYNCYTFGNGVESYRIGDSPAGKFFNLGERVLAVSNQDFKEADRFAGMTYSGVYSGAANSNNLNEFNLGLVNFKDCETSFGPIMKLHARETDILTLQEDKISYVLVKKNVITDSTGGGAIASVPEILGTQVARIEEFGISFNPESFTSWGYDMFFTDTKRGAVLNLRGASQGSDQLQVVSQYGMNSWFRDRFNAQLATQKLGGYDPYMNEYVLTTNNTGIFVPGAKVPCGTTLTQYSTTDNLNYNVSLGTVTGQVNIPYNITLGSIDIVITWNGSVVVNQVGLTGAGTLSFNKSLPTAQANVDIIVNNLSSYEITIECPPTIPLTVVQVVVNSPNYVNEFIHTSYNWTNTPTISPYNLTAAALTTSQPAIYQSSTGVRGVGVFPSSGSDINIRTQKIIPDNFDFDPALHSFKILSSSTLYSNSAADIASLLAASSVVSGPVTNPSTGVFQATEPAFNMPAVNDYLYLIWDLRMITSQSVCYCTGGSTIEEACCTCTPPCNTCYFGPQTQNATQVCATDTNSPLSLGLKSFSGAYSTPTIGDICYMDSTNTCNPNAQVNVNGTLFFEGFVGTGFYIVDVNNPSTTSPKKWIQVGQNGVVINSGTC